MRELAPPAQGLVAGPETALLTQIDFGHGRWRVQAQAHAQALDQFALLGVQTPRGPGADQIGHRSLAPVERHGQMATEARTRSSQVPQLLHRETQAATVAVLLHATLGDEQRVLGQQIALDIQQVLVDHAFDGFGAVVELEDRCPATLAVDDPEVTDDARQQLRLA